MKLRLKHIPLFLILLIFGACFRARPLVSPDTGSQTEVENEVTPETDSSDDSNIVPTTPTIPTEPNTTPAALSSPQAPFLMAFRASEGDPDVAHYADYEVIHDLDPAFLLEAKETYGDSKKVIAHSSFGVIGNSNRDAVYPAHWLFKTGSLARRNIGSTDTTIRVNDAGLFENGDHVLIRYRITGENRWDIIEEITVTADPDLSANTLTVTRGAFGSSALNWDTAIGDIILTPHYRPWNDVPNSWGINLSLESPVDPSTGMNGPEFYASYVDEHVWQHVLQSAIDGIEFDGAHYTFPSRSSQVDTNNDMIADYGYSGGVNVYGLGGIRFMRLVGERLGSAIILQADSSIPATGYRHPSTVNGIEMENFPQMEAVETFGESLTHLSYFAQNAGRSPKISYPLTKTDTRTYQCAGAAAADNSVFRFGLAAALLTDMPHAYATESGNSGNACFAPYDWDEYQGGDLDDADWLGQALGVPQRLVDWHDGIDLSSFTWAMNTTHADYQASLNSASGRQTLTVTQLASSVDSSGALEYPLIGGVKAYASLGRAYSSVSSDEWTLRINLSGNSTFGSYSSDYVDVPRLVRGILLASDGQTATYDLLVDSTQREAIMTFHFTSDVSIARVVIASGMETGSLSFSGATLYPYSAEKWARYFENGAVILNMTGEDIIYALENANSGSSYRRLTGSIDAVVNNGQSFTAEDASQVDIESYDALVLRRQGGD